MPNERELTPEEIAANVAKAEAEARKFDAEAQAALIRANSEAERDKVYIETEKLNQQEIQARLVTAQHDVDRAEHKRKRELSIDEHHHVYYFKGGVDGASVDKCLDQLKVWSRGEAPGEIEIVFFSPGGSVIPGMALFDEICAIRVAGWKFTTVCRGYAASNGWGDGYGESGGQNDKDH